MKQCQIIFEARSAHPPGLYEHMAQWILVSFVLVRFSHVILRGAMAFVLREPTQKQKTIYRIAIECQSKFHKSCIELRRNFKRTYIEIR